MNGKRAEKVKERLWELFEKVTEKLLEAISKPDPKPFYVDVAVKFLKANGITIPTGNLDNCEEELRGLYDTGLPFEGDSESTQRRAMSTKLKTN